MSSAAEGSDRRMRLFSLRKDAGEVEKKEPAGFARCFSISAAFLFTSMEVAAQDEDEDEE